MDDEALLTALVHIGEWDRRRWTMQPLRKVDRVILESLLDRANAPVLNGWVLRVDGRTVLAAVQGRLHWAGMSVLIEADPFRAVGQALRAIEATRAPRPDSRPG